MTSPAQRVFARSSRSLMNFDMSCGGRLHADSRLNKWDLLMSSVSISRISSISTSIASVGGSYSFCSSSYSHISTASRFRMRLIWCEPYLAVRNFSRRSFTSPFSVKLTRSPVRPGDRSQSFMVSTPHCISVRLLVVHCRRVPCPFRIEAGPWSVFWKIPRVVFVSKSTGADDHVVSKARFGGRGLPKSEWLILIKNFSNFPWTHIQQIDDDVTLTLSQIQASSPSFYYFLALLLYFYPHTHTRTNTSTPSKFHTLEGYLSGIFPPTSSSTSLDFVFSLVSKHTIFQAFSGFSAIYRQSTQFLDGGLGRVPRGGSVLWAQTLAS